MNIRRAAELPLDALSPLVEQSQHRGWNHLERLRDDWVSGRNRFAKPGEALLTGWEQDELVAVGGINHDPHDTDPRVGRLRRLYVHEGYRRRGRGALMVSRLLDHAELYFREVRIGAGSAAAGAFFESLGFAAFPNESTFTHALLLNETRRPGPSVRGEP